VCVRCHDAQPFLRHGWSSGSRRLLGPHKPRPNANWRTEANSALGVHPPCTTSRTVVRCYWISFLAFLRPMGEALSCVLRG